MLSLQEDVQQLTKDKGEVTESHAREIGDYESQLSALRHQMSELHGMVILYWYNSPLHNCC